MVNVSQGAVALGVLTLLFGGDLYSMFAGQPTEVGGRTPTVLSTVSLYNQCHERLLQTGAWKSSPDLAAMSDNSRVLVAFCTS